MYLLMALSRHSLCADKRLLSDVKRTRRGNHEISANDPKRTRFCGGFRSGDYRSGL